LASSLPTLIFIQYKPLSKTVGIIRLSVHFLLTLGSVFGLLLYYELLSFRASNIPAFIATFLFSTTFYLFAIFFHQKFILTKRKIRAEQIEQQNLLYYTEDVERQNNISRKFQHDYQNILLSIKGFLDDGDLEGLKKYYDSDIVVASNVITHNLFALKDIDKIKVKEIKSLLIEKILLAQKLNLNVNFEINKEINAFPVRSVPLVRMLGIILDNAIEALLTLEDNTLFIGCFKWEKGVYFIIQNPCPPDMPCLHEIWTSGFTTKGKRRGLGLINLLEIVDSLPNATLETDIIENDFIQKLSFIKD
jgi:two-component system sensor histidine kinase AgrC